MKTSDKNDVVRYRYSSSLSKEYKESKKRKKLDGNFSKPVLVSFYLITVAFFVYSALYGILKCNLSYVRAGQSLSDLFNSLGYYFMNFIDPEAEYITSVNSFPGVTFESVLPYTYVELCEIFSIFRKNFFNGIVFQGYLISISESALLILRMVVFILPVILLFSMLTSHPEDSPNAEWGIRTAALKRYDKIRHTLVIPIRTYCINYWRWLRSHYFGELLVAAWCFNLNAATVMIEAVAYYIFLCRFKDLNIYVQVYKLVLDIGIFISCSMWIINATVFLWLFNKWRKSKALKKLRKLELKTLEFFQNLSICILITATVGAGKTTLLTSLGLTGSLEFRNQALKRMYKYDKYFPNFPWLKFEKYIRLMIKRRQITNLATIEKEFRALYGDYVKNPVPANIYGYDVNVERTEYYTGLRTISIWEALETYAKLYFIYTMESSLIASNYSVREDYLVLNAGNFLLYDGDFFAKKINRSESHFSHILDFDTLRIGVTMVKDAAVRNSFEFGMIMITEFGKELGNNLENMYVKKTDTSCNVKNDLFVKRGKYSRHAGTVDGYAFVRYVGDEQRAMSLGADFREMCDIIDISENTEERTAYPLFYIESIVFDVLDGRFFPRYYNRRFAKGNESLYSYFSKNIICSITNPLLRTYNHYAYKNLNVIVRRGDDESTNKEVKVPIPYFKLYSDRFATDAHAQYFRTSALKADVSLNDFDTYGALQATDAELHELHSHAINEMDELGLTESAQEKSNN